MLLLGHRGARLSAPENTIAAFSLSLTHGCDGFEFDVRSTADGRAVICHDPRVRGVAVARARYSEVAARCPTLTTLEQVLARFSTTAYLYIELKVAGLEGQVLAAVAAEPPQRGYVIASFLPEVTEVMRGFDAHVPLGFICNTRRQLSRWKTLPVSAVMPHHRLVTQRLINELHGAGKQVFVWTVNDAEKMKALAEWGVDGVVSDDTKLLVRTLRR